VFGRRILVLVAVLMGLTALAASLTPPPQPTPRNGAATGPTPTPQAAEPQPVAAARTVSARLSEKGRPRTITARTGDTIELEVTGSHPDTVVSDDLAVSEPVDADSPAQVEIYADTPGSYPVLLLSSGRRIGTVRITRSS
jgi:plastocyanin